MILRDGSFSQMEEVKKHNEHSGNDSAGKVLTDYDIIESVPGP
jgi:hypothetical protein